jgi:phosphinothricin acetyltransferase
VSVYVCASRHRGRVGRALYAELFEILAHQGFINAYAGITLPNPVSIAFHQAMGFTLIGTYRRIGYKQGRWHDVVWFGRELARPSAEPADPTPLAALMAAGGLEGYLGAGLSFP